MQISEQTVTKQTQHFHELSFRLTPGWQLTTTTPRSTVGNSRKPHRTWSLWSRWRTRSSTRLSSTLRSPGYRKLEIFLSGLKGENSTGNKKTIVVLSNSISISRIVAEITGTIEDTNFRRHLTSPCPHLNFILLSFVKHKMLVFFPLLWISPKN